MPEKFKLGLTRNRLFEFDNCVCFVGKAVEKLVLSECEKSLKMLCLKEPLLTAVVSLESDGEAYVVLGGNAPALETACQDASEFVEAKRQKGMDFSQNLFSFALLNDDTLCIFAHTAIADARSLMHLADEFMAFYKKETISVESAEVRILSEINQMPSNVFSVVIDRLASGLDVGWQKNASVFGLDDYKNARESYLNNKSKVKELQISLPSDLMGSLVAFAQREKIDVSSLVAFAFYEGLTQTLGGKRRYRKLNVQTNNRIFLKNVCEMNVGAFNGYFAVEKKKNKKTPDTLMNNAVNFHKEIYKRATSSFSSFYNEFLLMRLPGSFCDSQYMYCAGMFNHKYSKKLADTYGCANEVVGEFCSYNLNQSIWSGLDVFENVIPYEPLKMRSSTLIAFVENREEGRVYFKYKEDKVPDSVAQSVTEKAIEILRKLK